MGIQVQNITKVGILFSQIIHLFLKQRHLITELLVEDIFIYNQNHCCKLLYCVCSRRCLRLSNI